MRNLTIKGDVVPKKGTESIELYLMNQLSDANQQIGYYKEALARHGIEVSPLPRRNTAQMSIYKAKGGNQ